MTRRVYALPPRLGDSSEPSVAGASCPGCCGVLAVHTQGKRSDLVFECRVGHTFTVQELLVAKEERYEDGTVDPLFRSVAARYGERVVGVLLSGMGADGVSGLIAIKKAGGMSLVQHPGEARFETMPCTAIAEVDVDAMLTVEQLAAVLSALAHGETVDAPRPTRPALT